MDETVNAAVMRVTLFSAFLLLVSGAAAAQPLQDPTRPPASLSPRQEGAAGAAPALEKRAPQLQSVLIARQPGGRHIAVIDGETLRLGEFYKGARVARIAQNEVELVRGRARQVLTLDGQAASNASGIKRTRTE